MTSQPIDAARLELAQRFLQEAVYRSRGAQAGKVLFAPETKSGCGLGKEAAVVLDLTPQAESLFTELWPQGLAPDQVEKLQVLMADWVQRQDQLDRDRNHFLKAFRAQHGASRHDYDTETLAQFEVGLDQVNGRVQEALAEVAGDLSCVTMAPHGKHPE